MTKINKHHNNIKIEIPESKLTECQECKAIFKTTSALAGHIGAKHKMSVENYLIKHYLPNGRPGCHECGAPTLFVNGHYSFKKYCKEHSDLGRKEWAENNGYGSKNGPDASWKKGLTKDNHDGVAKQANAIMGDNNYWFGKEIPDYIIEAATKGRVEKMKLTKKDFDKKKKELSKTWKINTAYSEYENVRQLLDVECCFCGSHEKRSLWSLQLYATCKTCSPSSREEQEVRDFVDSIVSGSLPNYRKAISPQELDIYVPSKNFAIEYNGLYWHTETRKGKTYHSDKTVACKSKDIKLFHIFSDEWRDKRAIVESMIKQRMNLSEKKIHARKCKIVEVATKQRQEFFDSTHVSGDTRSKIAFGLEFEGKLVCCLSLRTPFTETHKGSIEIARFASQLNTIVIGGFQKLLKYSIGWASNMKYESILTYADLRFGEGKVYENSGFDKIGATKLDYWYTDGKNRFDRFKYRAQNGKSEKQVAKENGVEKIFGCGSNRFSLCLVNK